MILKRVLLIDETKLPFRLSQVLNLNPTYILIAEVIFSNIGGTTTGKYTTTVF